MYISFLLSLTMLFYSSCIWAMYITHVSHFLYLIVLTNLILVRLCYILYILTTVKCQLYIFLSQTNLETEWHERDSRTWEPKCHNVHMLWHVQKQITETRRDTPRANIWARERGTMWVASVRPHVGKHIWLAAECDRKAREVAYKQHPYSWELGRPRERREQQGRVGCTRRLGRET